MNEDKQFIWMNNEFIPKEKANVSVLSHSLHFGSSVFEGIRGYKCDDGLFIFRLKEHIDRFFLSAKCYNYSIGYSKDEIFNSVIELVKMNKLDDCYIRPLYFLGTGWEGLMPHKDMINYMIIGAWPIVVSKQLETIKLKVSSVERISSKSLPMQAKASANYMNSYLIKQDALISGFNDGIALNSNGFITETATSNIFIIRDNKIFTPSLHNGALNGITRATVITIINNLGYEIIEKSISKDEIYISDEVFITGTASEVVGVSHIDYIELNKESPLTNKIFSEFRKIMTNKEYKEWKTYV